MSGVISQPAESPITTGPSVARRPDSYWTDHVAPQRLGEYRFEGETTSKRTAVRSCWDLGGGRVMPGREAER